MESITNIKTADINGWMPPDQRKEIARRKHRRLCRLLGCEFVRTSNPFKHTVFVIEGRTACTNATFIKEDGRQDIRNLQYAQERTIVSASNFKELLYQLRRYAYIIRTFESAMDMLVQAPDLLEPSLQRRKLPSFRTLLKQDVLPCAVL